MGIKTDRPRIQWKHIDGPMLLCTDGTMHWLTLRERILMQFGFTTILKLNEKYNNPQKNALL